MIFFSHLNSWSVIVFIFVQEVSAGVGGGHAVAAGEGARGGGVLSHQDVGGLSEGGEVEMLAGLSWVIRSQT